MSGARAGEGRASRRIQQRRGQVSAASIVNQTVIAAATATPYRKLTPSANMPSIAMHTMIPANMTARPEVSSDSIHRLLARQAAQELPAGSGSR